MNRPHFVAISLLLLGAVSASAAERGDGGIISHIRRERVNSSAVAAIGYSKRLHALEIEFVNGAIYRYADVPADVYRELCAAESKARFYDENIRGRYRSVHVRPRQDH
jgi:hypothetical protein